MTSPSTASTLADSWSRRQCLYPSADVRAVAPRPMPLGAAIPPILAPTELATDDSPRSKVLVVEDEAYATLDLQRMLRDAGFRVAGPATTLAEIQRLLERGPIGCALLDLDVNQRTPLPVADLLAYAEVPFVFMTTGTRAILPREHAHRPVLKKPFDKAGLLAALERAMRKGANAANDNLHTAKLGAVIWPRVFPSL